MNLERTRYLFIVGFDAQVRGGWEYLARMDDEEVDTSDILELGEDFFRRAELVMVNGNRQLTFEFREGNAYGLDREDYYK